VTIPIRQSELDAAGVRAPFPLLGWRDRRDVAARTLLAVGRSNEARLLQINNPNAVAGIVYVDDVPRRGRIA